MTDVRVPELGESVVDARIARWLKKPGDRVQAGEAIAELETDKIDLEVTAVRSGVLASVAHGEGADVKVGDVLAIIDETATAVVGGSEPTSPRSTATSAAGSPAVKATPTARRMATEHQVTLDTVPGSGPSGRVTKQDVQAAISRSEAPARASSVAQVEAPATAPPPARPAAPLATPAGLGARREERVRMSKRRATIARRLVEAQHAAAMLTTFNEVDMTAIADLRARHRDAFKERHGVGIGIASFFVKAVIEALRAFPLLNAEIQGDQIVLKHFYDIGMAVGAEGGLVVPVLRNADAMAFADIERAIRDVAARAANNSLTLEDLRGGTFTITNGGVFGSLMSTPILNPPQVGILGLHKIQDRAVAVGGQVVVRPMMYLALSYDHRIVDGREAVQFLVRIKSLIEDPGLLLIES